MTISPLSRSVLVLLVALGWWRHFLPQVLILVAQAQNRDPTPPLKRGFLAVSSLLSQRLLLFGLYHLQLSSWFCALALRACSGDLPDLCRHSFRGGAELQAFSALRPVEPWPLNRTSLATSFSSRKSNSWPLSPSRRNHGLSKTQIARL